MAHAVGRKPGYGTVLNKSSSTVENQSIHAHALDFWLRSQIQSLRPARFLRLLVENHLPGIVDRNSPSNLNSVELHPHTLFACQFSSHSPSPLYSQREGIFTEDGRVLLILNISTGTNDRAKVEVVDLLLELVDPVAPLLLARLALHRVLVDGRRGVEFRELGLERLVDLIIHLRQAQL